MRKILLLMLLLACRVVHGQEAEAPKADSVNAIPVVSPKSSSPKQDSPGVIKDSLRILKPAADSLRKDSLPAIDSTSGTRPVKPRPMELMYMVDDYPTIYGRRVGGYLMNDKRFGPTAPVIRVPQMIRQAPRVEWMFYLFCGILLLLSFLRLAFFKYFLDLFKVFFNTSMRQKQIREQLSQAPLPSLLLNIFFFIIGGIFIYFLMKHYAVVPDGPVALVVILSILALATLYLGKYIFVTMLGWTFDKKSAAENYLFVVFMVNKMAGLFLLPMTLLMAYTEPGGRQVIIMLTVVGLIILAIVRLVRGFAAVSTMLKINPLHFIVFVAAFEVIPVLLIYKGLLIFI